jgi:hypothetical protein
MRAVADPASDGVGCAAGWLWFKRRMAPACWPLLLLLALAAGSGWATKDLRDPYYGSSRLTCTPRAVQSGTPK